LCLTTHQLAVLIGSYWALPGEPIGAEVLTVEEFAHPRFGGDCTDKMEGFELGCTTSRRKPLLETVCEHQPYFQINVQAAGK
jgi:hypothetical protein